MITTKDEKKVKGWESPIAIHPGEFLRDVLEDNSISQIELAKRTGISKNTINEIVNGANPITRDTALKFSKVLPLSSDYWVNLQKIYDDDVARLNEQARIEGEIKTHLGLFKETYTELAKYNILGKYKWVSANFANIIDELLRYFAVNSLSYLKSTSLNFEAAFRKYDRKKINNYSLAAWLRLGQLKAKEIETPEFDKQKLKESLANIKHLSLETPKEYIPKIKDILLKSGVVLVCAPYFRNTHAQGATQWIEQSKYFIILKTSNQTEDKFWFNLFHELGHILRHGKKDTFINIEDGEKMNSVEQEREADEFAQKALLPNFETEIKRFSHYKNAIISIASDNKISPSIVAGRLAHECKDSKKAWALTNGYMRKIDYVDAC